MSPEAEALWRKIQRASNVGWLAILAAFAFVAGVVTAHVLLSLGVIPEFSECEAQVCLWVADKIDRV